MLGGGMAGYVALQQRVARSENACCLIGRCAPICGAKGNAEPVAQLIGIVGDKWRQMDGLLSSGHRAPG